MVGKKAKKATKAPKKRGRPYTGGRMPRWQVRMSDDLGKRVRAYMTAHGIDGESAALRDLIEAGLDAVKG